MTRSFAVGGAFHPAECRNRPSARLPRRVSAPGGEWASRAVVLRGMRDAAGHAKGQMSGYRRALA